LPSPPFTAASSSCAVLISLFPRARFLKRYFFWHSFSPIALPPRRLFFRFRVLTIFSSNYGWLFVPYSPTCDGALKAVASLVGLSPFSISLSLKFGLDFLFFTRHERRSLIRFYWTLSRTPTFTSLFDPDFPFPVSEDVVSTTFCLVTSETLFSRPVINSNFPFSSFLSPPFLLVPPGTLNMKLV